MTYLSIQTFILNIEKQLFKYITENARIKDQSYFPKHGFEIKSTAQLGKLTFSSFFDTFFQELPEEKKQLLATGFLISYLIEKNKMKISDILLEFNLSQGEATKSVKFAKRYLILENEKTAIKDYERELENIRFLKEEINGITSQITAIHKTKREQIAFVIQQEFQHTIDLLKNTSFKDAYSFKKMNFNKGDTLNSDIIKFLFTEEKAILNAIVEYRLAQNVIEPFKKLKKESSKSQEMIINRAQNTIETHNQTKNELKKRLQTKEHNLKLGYVV